LTPLLDKPISEHLGKHHGVFLK